jgi:hypothetical protein
MSNGGIWLLNDIDVKPAVYACTKPFRLTDPGDYNQMRDEDWERAFKIADKLARKNNGENKFLRMIHVTLEINAPRNWWSHLILIKWVPQPSPSPPCIHNAVEANCAC